MVFAGDHVALVDVNQVTLLVSRQNDLVVDVEVSLILDNVFDVFSSLHVVLAAVLVNADMAHFLVLCLQVVLLAHVIIILIIVVNVRVGAVLVSLGKLENHLVLLGFIFVVWIDQHVLIVICHVEVLLHLLGLSVYRKGHLFVLNCELRVLMLKEWAVVRIVFGLLVYLGV